MNKEQFLLNWAPNLTADIKNIIELHMYLHKGNNAKPNIYSKLCEILVKYKKNSKYYIKFSALGGFMSVGCFQTASYPKYTYSFLIFIGYKHDIVGPQYYLIHAYNFSRERTTMYDFSNREIQFLYLNNRPVLKRESNCNSRSKCICNYAILCKSSTIIECLERTRFVYSVKDTVDYFKRPAPLGNLNENKEILDDEEQCKKSVIDLKLKKIEVSEYRIRQACMFTIDLEEAKKSPFSHLIKQSLFD